jgi:hypothetical protein
MVDISAVRGNEYREGLYDFARSAVLISLYTPLASR